MYGIPKGVIDPVYKDVIGYEFEDKEIITDEYLSFMKTNLKAPKIRGNFLNKIYHYISTRT